jgi:hypothetical protein
MGMKTPIPVYVVNDQMSLLNDGDGFGAGSRGPRKSPRMKPSKNARLMTRFGKHIKNFGKGAGLLVGLGGGAALTAPAALSATSAGAATAAGVVGYGIGTLINKGIGAAMGHFTEGKYSGNGAIGSWLYDALHKNEGKPEGKIVVEFQGADRDLRITHMDSNNLEVETEISFAGLNLGAF